MKREKRIRKPINIAVRELESNLGEIFTVQEWADYMGYSRCYFSHKIKKRFGKSPKDLLTEVKLKKVKQLIQKNPDELGFQVATEIGFIDERSMYKFLKTSTGFKFSEIKDLL